MRFDHRFCLAISCLMIALPTAATCEFEKVTNSPQVAFGALLFNDASLSADGIVSCSNCHRQELAFTDGKRTSIGAFGGKGTRNAPSLLDVSDRMSLFWDGRRRSLDDLVLEPLLAPVEHGLANEEDLLVRVARSESLREAYKRAYGSEGPLTARNLAFALVAFVQSLRSDASQFEQYLADESVHSLDSFQMLGYSLFTGRAGCSDCHRASRSDHRLTDEEFHNRAVGDLVSGQELTDNLDRAMTLDREKLGTAILADAGIAALGRFLVTRKAADIGAFRTPALYNVAITAPYMHDGSIPTLKAAVDHEIYYSMADHGAQLGLEERAALVAFLESLTDQAFEKRLECKASNARMLSAQASQSE